MTKLCVGKWMGGAPWNTFPHAHTHTHARPRRRNNTSVEQTTGNTLATAAGMGPTTKTYVNIKRNKALRN